MRKVTGERVKCEELVSISSRRRNYFEQQGYVFSWSHPSGGGVTVQGSCDRSWLSTYIYNIPVSRQKFGGKFQDQSIFVVSAQSFYHMREVALKGGGCHFLFSALARFLY